MSDKAAVYDLGKVDVDDPPPRRKSPSTVNRSSRRRREPWENATAVSDYSWIREAWPVSFALLIPGAGHVLRGELRRGFFYLVSMGFFAALCWAILGTLDRSSATFEVLGLPPQIGLWALGGIFLLATATYVGNVCSSAPSRVPLDPLNAPRPLVAGIASLLIPGWGQAISGNRVSAALFLSGCWIVGGAWILVSPPAVAMLDSQGLYLPRALLLVTSPFVRWTLPAIIWILAAYDAAFRSSQRR